MWADTLARPPANWKTPQTWTYPVVLLGDFREIHLQSIGSPNQCWRVTTHLRSLVLPSWANALFLSCLLRRSPFRYNYSLFQRVNDIIVEDGYNFISAKLSSPFGNNYTFERAWWAHQLESQLERSPCAADISDDKLLYNSPSPTVTVFAFPLSCFVLQCPFFLAGKMLVKQ